MNAKKSLFVIVILTAVLALSAAIISAQDATQEPESFSDNRINEEISISMGGVAIYCYDANRDPSGNTFQNGGSIEVWDDSGQKLIVLTEAQLRGNEEIMQPVMAPDASATMEADMEPTEEFTPVGALPPATDEATGEPLPVLLARAAGPNGDVWMFRVNEDTFAIQGTDTTGKFYTYTWAGCERGTIATDTAPIIDFLPGSVVPEATMEATAEATDAA